MEKGKIICYNLVPANLTRRDVDKFQEKLNGRDNKSNFGKYTYHRDGLLDRIPHIKPVRSVIVVLPESAGEILDLLKRYGAEIFARDIILEKRDVEALTRRGKQG